MRAPRPPVSLLALVALAALAVYGMLRQLGLLPDSMWNDSASLWLGFYVALAIAIAGLPILQMRRTRRSVR